MQKKENNIAGFAMLMLFSTISSVIISQALQLQLKGPDDVQAYLVLYVYCFSPLILIYIYSLFFKSQNSNKILLVSFLTFLTIFAIITIIAFFKVRPAEGTLKQYLLDSFKYFIVYILKSDNFNTYIIKIYLSEFITFGVYTWLTKYKIKINISD